MIHFDLPKEKSSIIKVIGIGGGGSNAVNHMYSQNIEGVNFIICNTDAQAIALSNVPNKIQLGPHLTQGLGAGANPSIGKQATEESLEEIKRILEVNTKMAFITAGMGGGTGTGGAPIISKICKDLGILTVGIVTTPFAYEGKKRQLQAEQGIGILKEYVDTLLVISNDKLRHQFGNLKMKEAFAKADNVLATAAKCITDVINTTGQINVDFADVCTVMRNGGVAILGSASVEGESRAQLAIEEALNSPLLNDNDISGAKWILININSAEGDHEFTMDEVEVIQNYLLSRAGENTDVILGLGYDNTLERKIGITLIATGFEYKDPFYKKEEKKPELKKEEKVVLTLQTRIEEPVVKQSSQFMLPLDEVPMEESDEFSFMMNDEPALPEELKPVLVDLPEERKNVPLVYFTNEDDGKNTVDKKEVTEKIELVYSLPTEQTEQPLPFFPASRQVIQNNSPASAASGGYLAKPSNIYAEPKLDSIPGHITPSPLNESVTGLLSDMLVQKEEEPSFDMKLVIKEDTTAADKLRTEQTLQPIPNNAAIEEPAMRDEIDEQKRRASERIQKLRNLSFNINGADTNNEFDTVPAYIRRNLELYNTVNSVENFYSNYTVKTDENNNMQISTINTFLDGKKPD
ncbi:MAG: cell division protein FtsZ [Chitinophagaceae bacterium]|nr:cell division protein FtsZ [Chitinophagaceae bacterium]